MKIKSDFVTNSSSSSFILFFNKKINSINDLKGLIDEKYIKTILNDCKGQTPMRLSDPNTMKQIIEALSDGYVMGMDNSTDFEEDQKDFCKRNNITKKELNDTFLWLNQFWEESTKRREIDSAIMASDILSEENTNPFIYMVEYSDEDGGYFSEIEHGNTFRRIKHITISHH